MVLCLSMLRRTLKWWPRGGYLYTNPPWSKDSRTYRPLDRSRDFLLLANPRQVLNPITSLIRTNGPPTWPSSLVRLVLGHMVHASWCQPPVDQRSKMAATYQIDTRISSLQVRFRSELLFHALAKVRQGHCLVGSVEGVNVGFCLLCMESLGLRSISR